MLLSLAELNHRKVKDAFDGHKDANVLGGKSDKSGRQDGEEGEDQATGQRRHPEDIFSAKVTKLIELLLQQVFFAPLRR